MRAMCTFCVPSRPVPRATCSRTRSILICCRRSGQCIRAGGGSLAPGLVPGRSACDRSGADAGRSRGIALDRGRQREQADRGPARHHRGHRQRPRQEHSCETGRQRPDACGDHWPQAGHHRAVGAASHPSPQTPEESNPRSGPLVLISPRISKPRGDETRRARARSSLLCHLDGFFAILAVDRKRQSAQPRLPRSPSPHSKHRPVRPLLEEPQRNVNLLRRFRLHLDQRERQIVLSGDVGGIVRV